MDKQAEEMCRRLIEKMAERQGVTENPKAEQPMEWVGRMGNSQACAREVVNSELIYA
ncbi:MAG: TnpV protein [Candidatus Woodwardiibium sp.]|jgi:tnpV protein